MDPRDASKAGKVCAVAECREYSRNKDISMHRFPRDPRVRKIWIFRTHRKDKFNPETSRICSLHFTPEDFERDLQAELLGSKPRAILKAEAVPSLNLRKIPDVSKPGESSRRARMLRKHRDEEQRALLQEAVEHLPSTGDDVREEISPEPEDPAEPEMQVDAFTENYQQMYENAIKKNQSLEEMIKSLIEQNTVLKEKLEKTEASEKEHLRVLNKVFTANEVALLLDNKRKVVRWTADEMRNAFTLRYLSKKAYIYLRSTRGFPFPGITTLKRWAGRLDLKNGILKEVLNMMKVATHNLIPRERLCVLSFDEVKIQETLEYDEHEDIVIGPHRQMQVAMARSLTGKWKQPVFIDFDRQMTEDILFELISELSNSGYKVVSLVSDCAGGNVGLWEKLGITCENPFFIHPGTNKKIVYMPDVPHLLKLLRNWLLDSGFTLSSGDTINKKPLEELLKQVNTEISPCPKLKELHLSCQKTQRQNVALAAQLVSNTVGSALVRYTPGENKKLAMDTGNFLILMNRWFDLMNTYVPKKSAPSKSPFGLAMDEQCDLLNQVFDVVSGMRCIGKSNLLTFQKGIMMTCKGLPILYQNVLEDGVKFILTHKLNQDCLENLFGQIRAKGGLYDHPSPLGALYRLRSILLGNNPGLVKANTNINLIENSDVENFILGDVLLRADISPTLPPNEEVISPVGYNLSTSSSDASVASGSTSTTARQEEAPKDGLHYLSGWLAFKFKNKYPQLVDRTSHMKDHSYALPSWIRQLSLGGLTSPSPDFLVTVTEMEKRFLKMSKKKDFLTKKNIVKKIVFVIKNMKNVNLPEEVIKKFARLRLIIRIRYLLHNEARFIKKRKMATKLKDLSKKQKLLT